MAAIPSDILGKQLGKVEWGRAVHASVRRSRGRGAVNKNRGDNAPRMTGQEGRSEGRTHTDLSTAEGGYEKEIREPRDELPFAFSRKKRGATSCKAARKIRRAYQRTIKIKKIKKEMFAIAASCQYRKVHYKRVLYYKNNYKIV